MYWYIRSFFDFTFLNILYFSNTLVLTSSIEVVFILSISMGMFTYIGGRSNRISQIYVKYLYTTGHAMHLCQPTMPRARLMLRCIDFCPILATLFMGNEIFKGVPSFYYSSWKLFLLWISRPPAPDPSCITVAKCAKLCRNQLYYELEHT